MREFNVEIITDLCTDWIKRYFDTNGKGCNAVIGISGGKDSAVVAGLCTLALGKDRVIGVLMPNGDQADIADSNLIIDTLGIKGVKINIHDAYSSIIMEIVKNKDMETITEDTVINLPPRLRNATLFAVSQSMNGRVANTCNFSEDWVGYSTLYGDLAGQFAPLARLTKTEVVEIGRYIFRKYFNSEEAISRVIDKSPSDGLCGKTDEDKLGFTYDVLDKYIRTGVCEDINTKSLIDDKHRKNAFKCIFMTDGLNLIPIEGFDPDLMQFAV